jgi:hypothetical protein
VGRYVADFVVDRRVIVETKVAKAIDPVHRAQVSNYLRASGLEVGLVMNFGSSVQFKRVVASPRRVQVATTDESKLLLRRKTSVGQDFVHPLSGSQRCTSSESREPGPVEWPRLYDRAR